MSKSPSRQAKAMGLVSLAQVSTMTGTSVQTLLNWHTHKPLQFEITLLGCVAKLETDTGAGRLSNAVRLILEHEASQ